MSEDSQYYTESLQDVPSMEELGLEALKVLLVAHVYNFTGHFH